MSRVEINSGGRHVIVEQDSRDAEMLAKQALDLWLATAPDGIPVGPAFGFAQTQVATTARRGARPEGTEPSAKPPPDTSWLRTAEARDGTARRVRAEGS
jgi:hypothetical protein